MVEPRLATSPAGLLLWGKEDARRRVRVIDMDKLGQAWG